MSILKGKKILVVDDEAMLREVFREELEFHGASVKEAANGAEAWPLLQAEAFDAVVSDVQMPNINGIELAKKIRSLDLDRPKIALVTGHTDVEVMDVYKIGVNLFLTKPFDLTTLPAKIDSLLLPLENLFALPLSSSPVFKLEKRFSTSLSAIQNTELMIGRGGLTIKSDLDLSRGQLGDLIIEMSDDLSLQAQVLVLWSESRAPGETQRWVGLQIHRIAEPSARGKWVNILQNANGPALVPASPSHANKIKE